MSFGSAILWRTIGVVAGLPVRRGQVQIVGNQGVSATAQCRRQKGRHAATAGQPGTKPAATVAFVVLALFSTAAPAKWSGKVCGVAESDITYLGTEADRSFGSTIPLWRVRVDGLTHIRFATRALHIDFPSRDSRLRFFYVRRSIERGNVEVPLIGCLYTNTSMLRRGLRVIYDVEGNASARVVAVFTRNLGRGIGNTLFVILRWRLEGSGLDASGYFYSVYAYGGTGRPDWSGMEQFELARLEEKAFGLSGGVVGVRDDGAKLAYPYTNETAVVARLRELGYLK